MAIIGKRLKKAREDAKLTQVDAAKKLGISNGTLSGYERNYRDPDTDIINSMADLYNVSIEWLMGREVKSNYSKDERDIAKRLEAFKDEIENSDGLAFDGEPMSDEAKESLAEAMEHLFRQTQRINKKYIPKQHRE
ncbi:helix-turn-helix domain-containing protein [Psychrobacillus sp. FSL K6-2684]|uniref:helix-turn-helix domain-containing protein n=1 Tax=Psychrobacillus sp. FSL K6-2684 TaxID=2921547 RepID=UPI0030FBCF2F